MFKKVVSDGSVGGDFDVTAKKTKKVYFTTTKIAYLGMFVAINVVIGALSPRLGSLKITLTYTLCFLAGYFYGAIAGGIVGGIGDLLGCLIAGYPPNPFILLASVLLGAIPGLVKYINIKKLGKHLPCIHIVLSFILVYVVCTLFINTYGNYVLGMSKGNTFWIYMIVDRIPKQTPVVAVNLALTVTTYPIFSKIFLQHADKT